VKRSLFGLSVVFLVTAVIGCRQATSPATSVSADYTSANIGVLKVVPAGTFQYDSTSTDLATISTTYHLSKYDITRAEFTAVTSLSDPSDTTVFTGTSDPVQQVTWYQALVFCNDLSILEGLTPVYTIGGSTTPSVWITAAGSVPTSDNATWDAVTANWSATGYRLPTQMELIWASMGATEDARSGDISSGVNLLGYFKGYAGSTETGNNQANIKNYAWTSNNATRTNPVGQKLANELGLFDMSGNVWQWCWDNYSGVFCTGSVTDYRGSASGTLGRSIHGGAWNSFASLALVQQHTYSSFAYTQDHSIGFRVARQ
jgi:formylglycine-generating enzyme required for sulfatase activity